MAEERADEQGFVIQVLENANWEHVQRMFPYQAGTGGLGRILRFEASSGTNPSAEVRLKTVADEQRYDNIVCGLLSFRSEFRGSCFPLTPVVRQRAVWMTCQHVTKGGELKMNLSTNHNMRYPKDAVRHSDVMIKPNTHDNLQHSTVSYPSDPSKSLLLWEYGDVATFEVVKYGTCEKLDQYTHFFIPSGQSPVAGEMVTCIGYPGPLTLKEASRILATEDDYREHVDMCEQEGNAPLPISEFKLDLPTALSRRVMMDDPTDGVYTSDVLNASPGEVVASDGNVVQYKCTTLPQMSGCPCVLLEKPFKLVAMHIQGGGQLDRNFNFGVSVKHIEFVRAYVLTVLPRLQKDLGSIYAIDKEAMSTLRGYLQAVDGCVDKLQLRPIVDKFLLAVQEQITVCLCKSLYTWLLMPAAACDLRPAATWLQAQAFNKSSMQDAQESPGASGRVDANATLLFYQQEAAAEDETAAMPAKTSFLQAHDSRPQACPEQSRNGEASPSSNKLQESEVLQLKQDNQLLQNQIQAQQRQIVALQQSTTNSHQQTTSIQRHACTISEVLRFLEGASAQQLVEVLQKVLQLLRAYEPAELDDITSPRDPKAERVEQLLRSLGPQLQGSNTKEWVDALRCLTEVLDDVSVSPSDLHKAKEDVDVLKQSCLSGHKPDLQRLVSQLEELCKSWHGWLSCRPNCIANYERGVAKLQQLQDRAAVCALAQRMTRQK